MLQAVKQLVVGTQLWHSGQLDDSERLWNLLKELQQHLPQNGESALIINQLHAAIEWLTEPDAGQAAVETVLGLLRQIVDQYSQSNSPSKANSRLNSRVESKKEDNSCEVFVRFADTVGRLRINDIGALGSDQNQLRSYLINHLPAEYHDIVNTARMRIQSTQSIQSSEQSEFCVLKDSTDVTDGSMITFEKVDQVSLNDIMNELKQLRVDLNNTDKNNKSNANSNNDKSKGSRDYKTRVDWEKLKQLDGAQIELQRELAICKQQFQLNSKDCNSLITGCRSQLQQLRKIIGDNNSNTIADSNRPVLERFKVELEKNIKQIDPKLCDLSADLNEMKTDILRRASYPTADKVSLIKQQLQNVSNRLSEIEKFQSGTVKQICKATWESELSNVVQEQKLMESLQLQLNEYRVSCDSLSNDIESIEKIISHNTTKSADKRLWKRPTSQVDDVGGMESVMNELVVSVDKDSIDVQTRRMSAIDRVRRQIQSEEALLLQEIKRGVKLKPSGGIEELDLRLSRRTRNKLCMP